MPLYVKYFFVFILFVSNAVFSLTYSDYAKLPEVSNLRISPNGEMVAFRKRDANNESMLAIYSLKEKKFVTGTKLGDLNLHDLYFLHDDVVIIRAGKEKKLVDFKEKFEMSSAYSFNIKTKKLHPLLTAGDKILIGQMGLGDIVGISPDGKFAYMPAYRKVKGYNADKGDQLYRKGDPQPLYSLMKANLRKKKSPKILEAGSPYSVNFFVYQNGQVAAEYRVNDRLDKYEVIAYDGKKERTIYEYSGKRPELSVIGLTQDESSLVVTAYSSETGYESYYTMSLATGEVTQQDVAKENTDIGDLYTDFHQRVYGIRFTGLIPSYRFFDEKVDKKVQTILQALPDHAVTIADHTPDWSRVVVYVEGSTAPGDFYIVDERGQFSFIMSARPYVDPKDIHPIATFSFKTKDGLTIPTLLTIPKAHVSHMKNLPAVMLPHGGPESHDTLGFNWLAQSLANEGYLVIQPQFRGSNGFGVAHRDAGYGEWGKKMQSDLNEALDKLVAKGMVDAQRVCIAGASYGGYAALAAGAFTPNAFQCVVSINGVSNLPKMLSQEKSDHGRYSWVLDYWKQVMTNNEGGKAAMKAVSPSEHVNKFTKPVLLIHGDQDKVVSYKQSKWMHQALTSAGKKSRLVRLKGEGHYLKIPESRTLLLEETVKFINQHIGEK